MNVSAIRSSESPDVRAARIISASWSVRAAATFASAALNTRTCSTSSSIGSSSTATIVVTRRRSSTVSASTSESVKTGASSGTSGKPSARHNRRETSGATPACAATEARSYSGRPGRNVLSSSSRVSHPSCAARAISLSDAPNLASVRASRLSMTGARPTRSSARLSTGAPAMRRAPSGARARAPRGCCA